MTSRKRKRRVTDSDIYRNKLNRKLYEAALEGEDTDLILVFGKFNDSGAPMVHVHSSILKLESRVFRTWINSDCWNGEFIKSADSRTLISLPADDPDDFKSFLKFLYGQTELIDKELHKVVIPAFRVADKYEALNVVKVCQDEFFPLVIKGLNDKNSAEVMALAQQYFVDFLSDEVLKYVERQPWVLYQQDSWINKMGEDVLTRILSTDSYKYPDVPVLSYKFTSWSANEVLIFGNAMTWLRRKEALVQKHVERVGGYFDIPLAVRVLQNIRFCQMDARDFEKCVYYMWEFLTPDQIGIISMVRISFLYGFHFGEPYFTSRKWDDGQFQFPLNTKMRHDEKKG